MGTNNTPDMNIGIDDNFKNLLEDMPSSEALNMGLGVGIIGGILIGIFLCLCLVVIVYFLSREDNPSTDITEESESGNTETTVTKPSNNEKYIKYIGIFLIIAMVIGTIIGIQNVDGYFKKDYETSEDSGNNQSSTPEYNNAKNTDIIINVNNMDLSIQASEKIEGLIVKINYLDKDKNILKTETVNVGKIAPGNTFHHTLTKSGMQISDLDKLKSVAVDVIEGKISENK